MIKDPIEKYNKIYIYSPHYDDTFLSLGGYLGLSNEFGKEITSIIVFGKSNNVYKTKLPKDKIEYASSIRCEEEKKNIDLISGNLIVWENYEANIRGHKTNKNSLKRYPYEIKLEYDKSVISKVVNQVRQNLVNNKEVLHLFPLSIGNLVDHLIVRQCLSKVENGFNIGFYEDLPYAIENSYIEKISDNMNSVLLPVNLEKKRLFIQNYQSQLAEKWIDDITNYMLSISKQLDIYFERIWLMR